MSITRGAKKAHRNAQRKRVFNQRRIDKVRDSIKSLKKTAASGNKTETLLLARKAQGAIDKAVKGGMMKKNTASRRKAYISKLVKGLG